MLHASGVVVDGGLFVPDAKTLKFEVAVGTDGAVSGLKLVTKTVDDTTQSVKFGSGKAGTAVDGLTESLRRYKTEQTQQARTANFFAQQLVEIIPGADGAKNALRGLIAIGLGGFGWGMLIEGTIFALGALKKVMDEDRDTAKQMKAAFDETFASASRAMMQVQKDLLGARPKSQEAWEKQAEEAGKAIAKLRTEIKELEDGAGPIDALLNLFGPSDELVKKQKLISQIVRGLNEAKPVKLLAESSERILQSNDISRQIAKTESDLSDEVVKLNVEKNAKLAELDRRRDIVDEADRQRMRVAIEQDANERIRRLREDHVNSVRSLERTVSVAMGDEVAKIRAETANKINDLLLKLSRSRDEEEQQLLRRQIHAESVAGDQRVAIADAANRKMTGDARAALEKQFSDRLELQVRQEHEVTDLRFRFSDERFGQEMAQLQRQAQQEKQRVRELQRDGAMSFEEMNDTLRKIDAETRKRMVAGWIQSRQAWIQGFTRPLTQTFQAAFHSMIDSTQDFGEAMKNIAVGVIDELIGALVEMGVQAIASFIAGQAIAKATSISTTAGHIAEAVAGAAASQAFIPFAGPTLALEAAATMLASLGAMTAPLLAAREGFDVPAGMNPVTRLHEREMVLPQQYADVIRDIGDGEGGTGGTQIVIQAVDARSFDQFLRQPGASRAMVRSIKKLNRARRI